jgi:hypothetical protein
MTDLTENQSLPLPEWRSDWLYSLVFKELENHWSMPIKPTAPDDISYVLFEEWSADDGGDCTGVVIRAWVRDENGVNEITLQEHSEYIKNDPKAISFCLSVCVCSFSYSS